MRKAIKTVAEVREYATSKYNEGGDIVIECWSDNDIEEFIKRCGKRSVRNSLDDIFSQHNEQMYESTKILFEEPVESTEPTESEVVSMTQSARANKVTIDTTSTGYLATFYKTHAVVGKLDSNQTDWVSPRLGKTADREDFRKYAISKCDRLGIIWKPDYQAQAWDRHYWKYENDEQVIEDAITLMEWTINKVCTGCKYKATVKSIELDAINPVESNLSYVKNGKYVKNGNWAVAQVDLNVVVTVNGTELDIIYPIEMRSGQLTKIKLTKSDIDEMIADSGLVD